MRKRRKFNRTFGLLNPDPKMLDPLEAISQAMEICGNYAGAIAALNEEIELAAMDWDITEGEFVDRIRREITRLERAAAFAPVQ